jgi:hypothetical protein
VKTPPGLVVAADGFIKRGFPGAKTGFSQSPLKFLLWMLLLILRSRAEKATDH